MNAVRSSPFASCARVTARRQIAYAPPPGRRHQYLLAKVVQHTDKLQPISSRAPDQPFVGPLWTAPPLRTLTLNRGPLDAEPANARIREDRGRHVSKFAPSWRFGSFESPIDGRTTDGRVAGFDMS